MLKKDFTTNQIRSHENKKHAWTKIPYPHVG
jgi:hypothetical protein